MRSHVSLFIGLVFFGLLWGSRSWPARAQTGASATPGSTSRLLLAVVMQNGRNPTTTPTQTGTTTATSRPSPTGPAPISTAPLPGTPFPTRTPLPGGVERPQDRHTVQTSTAGTVPYKYWRYLPAQWATDTTRTWPVLIFLHGIGEIGDDPNKVLVNGPPRLINEGNDMCYGTPAGPACFIVLSPQVPAGQGWWNDRYIHDLISIAITQLRGDPKRLYLTGLSMGGGGTWTFAAGTLNGTPNAQRLAAIAPIAGAAGPSGAGPCRLAAAQLPVFAFHGDADGTVSVQNSINWVNAINACTPAPDPAARLLVYPGVGHDSWTRTYDPRFLVEPGRNLYQWLLQFTR